MNCWNCKSATTAQKLYHENPNYDMLDCVNCDCFYVLFENKLHSIGVNTDSVGYLYTIKLQTISLPLNERIKNISIDPNNITKEQFFKIIENIQRTKILK